MQGIAVQCIVSNSYPISSTASVWYCHALHSVLFGSGPTCRIPTPMCVPSLAGVQVDTTRRRARRAIAATFHRAIGHMGQLRRERSSSRPRSRGRGTQHVNSRSSRGVDLPSGVSFGAAPQGQISRDQTIVVAEGVPMAQGTVGREMDLTTGKHTQGLSLQSGIEPRPESPEDISTPSYMGIAHRREQLQARLETERVAGGIGNTEQPL